MVGVEFDTPTTELATEMITDAENEIDKYLSRRYDISSAYFQTSTSIPPLVRSLATKLAEGYMWSQNARAGKDSVARGEKLVKSVLDNLQMISEYKLHLLDSAGSRLPESDNSAYSVKCNTSDYPTTFNEDDALSWAVSTDKLDDIASNERD
jgi:phage gp36-like protein